MKHIKIKLLITFIICFTIVSSSFVVSATSYSYTHKENVDSSKSSVYSKNVYTVDCVLNASSLGLTEKLSGMTDLYKANDGTIYLLCGDNSKLFTLNGDYTFKKEIVIKDEYGEVDYSEAKGVFVDTNGDIFISDTINNRVIICNSDGIVYKELTLPESSLIPEDFIFEPTKVVKDSKGYTYVLCLGSYYGAILYSPKNEFLGFFGSNSVKSSILDSLSYIWDLITSNDEKKSQNKKSLPFAFVDLCINQNGYIYTCTGATTTNGDSGQIKMLSPGGDVILYKRDFDGSAVESSNYNFLENETINRLGYNRVQNLVAVDVSENGFIYALDNTYGYIYLYDSDCNLISVFGGGVGEGNQKSTFVSANSLAINGTDVLVTDEKRNTITVFKLTDFGKLLLDTQNMFLNGDYSATKDSWNTILGYDAGNMLALKGLAKAYYSDGDIDNALKYAQLGNDYVIYDYAHQAKISDFINKNFVWLFAVGLMVLIGIVYALIKLKKNDIVLIKNKKLRVALSAFYHPFISFSEVRYNGNGSVLIAICFNVLLLVSQTLKVTECGFLFKRTDLNSYNSLFTFAQTIGLILLWSIANWAVCTVFQGKGKLKEVYVCSSYSIMPLIIYNFLFILLSHIISINSLNIVNSIYTVVLVFTFCIFSIAIMTVHEYNFVKYLLTGVVTVLFMILIVFIGFMIFILVQQFVDFIYSIFMEVVYR